MSAKKSFDLERKSLKVSAKPAPRKSAVRTAPPPKSPKPRASLRARREAVRNATNTLILGVVVLVLGAAIYGLWRPEVRISDVRAKDIPDTEGAALLAKESITGRYFGMLPRDSIFFYPEEAMRTAVLAGYPSLSAVSVTRTSFTSVTVSGTRRVAAFYWCGESAAAFSVTNAACYEADTEGLVFARAADGVQEATSSSPLLRVYSPLEGGGTSYPIRGMVTGAKQMPNLLHFVRAVKTLGMPVLSTFINGDEAELFVTPETRIKYVLGREEEAAKNAEAAFPNLNLLDGTIEYIDLRFDGKVYIKRYE